MTIVFGGSGFIASGAFQFGSEGSEGNQWVRVAAAEQAVEVTDEDEAVVEDADDSDVDDADDDAEPDVDDLEEPEFYRLTLEVIGERTVSVNPSADRSTTGIEQPYIPGREVTLTVDDADGPWFHEWQGDIDDADPEATEITVVMDQDRHVIAVFDQPRRSLLQIITNPHTSGNLVSDHPDIRWEGEMTGSNMLIGDENGLLERFAIDNANRNAISRIGRVDGNGRPAGRYAFLVINGGDPEQPGDAGIPVRVEMRLYAADGTDIGETNQIRIPYQILDAGGSMVGSGNDLLQEAPELEVGHIIQTVIVIDSTTGTDVVEQADYLDVRYEPMR